MKSSQLEWLSNNTPLESLFILEGRTNTYFKLIHFVKMNNKNESRLFFFVFQSMRWEEILGQVAQKDYQEDELL